MTPYCEFRMAGCTLLESCLPAGSTRPRCLYPDKVSTDVGHARCPLVVIKNGHDRDASKQSLGLNNMLVRDPRVNAEYPHIIE